MEALLRMKDMKVSLPELLRLHIAACNSREMQDRSEADFVVGLEEGALDAHDFATIN